MTHHTELLNYIAEKINAEHYLEVGVFNPDHNFNKINVRYKIGVDPDPKARATKRMTSDKFFSTNKTKFDLIWLDGLHHKDQIKKDIINAFKCLNEGGIIAIHDSNPHSEALTCVPRGSQREWTGDVYRTICQIVSPKMTVDFDYGCCVLRKEDGLEWNDINVTWEEFDKNRNELLSLVSVEEALKLLDKNVTLANI